MTVSPGNSNSYLFLKAGQQGPKRPMEPTRPRHSMPNSLALWLLWVCRDLQVSDVLAMRLAVVGKTTAWTGAHAGSMPTKSHTPPRVGRCRAYGAWCKQALSYWESTLYFPAADPGFGPEGEVGNGDLVVVLPI
jgi:hypothetical protein